MIYRRIDGWRHMRACMAEVQPRCWTLSVALAQGGPQPMKGQANEKGEASAEAGKRRTMAAMRSQKVKGFFTIATREVGMPAAAVATRAEKVRTLSIVCGDDYLVVCGSDKWF